MKSGLFWTKLKSWTWDYYNSLNFPTKHVMTYRHRYMHAHSNQPPRQKENRQTTYKAMHSIPGEQDRPCLYLPLGPCILFIHHQQGCKYPFSVLQCWSFSSLSVQGDWTHRPSRRNKGQFWYRNDLAEDLNPLEYSFASLY